MSLASSAFSQRRESIQRSLERHLISNVPQDSSFITTDSLGRQNYVTLDSVRQVLGVDTLEVTGKNFFNYGLTQEAPSIKHIMSNGDFIEVEGQGGWLFDGLSTFEVDSWTSDVGGRIDIDDGTGITMQGMDTRLEMTTNQVYIETDLSFFQVSDFSGGRMVFRSSAYRFSDGSGGQYPSADLSADTIAVLDSQGFLGVIPKSTLSAATYSYDTVEVATQATWIDGSQIYVRTFQLGDVGGFTDVQIDLLVADVDRIVKFEGYANTGNSWVSLESNGIDDDQIPLYFSMPIAFGNDCVLTIWYTKT